MITPDSATVHTNTIEGPRLSGQDQVEARGFALRTTPWQQPEPVDLGGRLGVDAPLDGAKDLSRALAALRSRLLPVEVERFRALGGACAGAMDAAIRRVRPGMSEWQIAAALAGETYAREVTPIVVLIATDERIHRYRHPLPTSKIMDCYAMLVLCGRQAGLVCSVTRLAHFGALPQDIRAKMQLRRGGRSSLRRSRALRWTHCSRRCKTPHARAGFADEEAHHQGARRLRRARVHHRARRDREAGNGHGLRVGTRPSPASSRRIRSRAAGGQSAGNSTAIDGWPVRAIAARDQTVKRPLILEVL